MASEGSADLMPRALARDLTSNDVRAASWQALVELLYEGAWQPQLGRYRSTFAFRGVSDARFDLRTSLARLGGDAAELERHILRSFRKYASRDAVPGDSLWNWMAVAQHHGAPTRLLDWSYSPFVALHFATQHATEFDRDGVVWMVDFSRTNALL